MSIWRRVTSVLALSTLAIPALAMDLPKQVTIQAVKVQSPPQLDGVLNDECWQSLPEYTNFTDGDTRALNKCQTTARICYDENNIYVAFHASHPNPSRIRAQETKRNGDWLRKDDLVTVNIDSQHTHRNESSFSANPLGTQMEDLQRSVSYNIQYKGDWNSATKIVNDGYNVEMAIPFSLLVYNTNQDSFGISFTRHLADDSITSVWPDLNGTYDLRYYANWTNLDLSPPELAPKILSNITGTSGENDARRNYQGMDIKYPLSSSSVAMISINPDSNNIEQQAESIDFSYAERWLDDARPFFSEWSVPVDGSVFDSRNVHNFNTGIKLAGVNGPDSYGLMSMRSFGNQSDTVISYSRNIGNLSMLQFDLSDHRTPGSRNAVSYMGGVFTWTNGQRTNTVNTGLSSSTTTDLPNGHLWHTDFESTGTPGDLNLSYTSEIVEDSFNSETGYGTGRGSRGGQWSLWRETVRRDTNLQSIRTALNYTSDRQTGSDNSRSMFSPSVTLSYVDGHDISFAYMRQKYRNRDEKAQQLSIRWNSNVMNRDGRLRLSYGQRMEGNYFQSGVSQKFRIGRKIAMETEWNLVRLSDTRRQRADTRSQTAFTLNYDLDNERSLGGRLVTTEGDRNVFCMYRQQVRSGTDAYLIYGDPDRNSTGSRLNLKLVKML